MRAEKIKIKVPLSGEVMKLVPAGEKIFSPPVLGARIDPDEYTLFAPCKATVISFAESKHAVTLKHSCGVEIFIHVGLNTENLNGKGFTLFVDSGQQVEEGTPLLKFDPFVLAQAGAASLLTTVTLAKANNWQWELPSAGKKVKAGKDVLFLLSTKKNTKAKKNLSAGEENFSAAQAVILNPQGIHARPAAMFASVAKQFVSHIKVLGGRSEANGKSPLSLMAADISWGSAVSIEARGSDSREAVKALVKLLHDGMGEIPLPPAKPQGRTLSQTSYIKNVPRNEAGVTAAGGFAFGEALIYFSLHLEIREKSKGSKEELEIFHHALKSCEDEIYLLIENARNNLPTEKWQTTEQILQTHLALLYDEELIAETLQYILDGKSAPSAYATVVQSKITVLQNLSNMLLADRAIDLKDIQYRMLQKFSHSAYGSLFYDQILSEENSPAQILLAHDLTPSEFIKITSAKTSIKAICLAQGSPDSHTSILAGNAGIPMLVKLGEHILNIPAKTCLIVDADKSVLKVFASEKEFLQAQEKIDKQKKIWSRLLESAQKPCVTQDGFSPLVSANCETPEAAGKAVLHGADALGLVRSEFIFSKDNHPPNEETQFQFYNQIMQAMQGRRVTFRTLDIGGDKVMPYLPLVKENNPLLGLRGIRVSLFSGKMGMNLFRSQVRAILRLQPYEARKILLPMISDKSELLWAKKIIEEERKKLSLPPAPVGVMIEVPSAALMSHDLAHEADFFSIGSNDLAQYVLAMDRTNSFLSDRLNTALPALLRLIDITLKSAQVAKIPVALCGNLASQPRMAALLLGMGIDELSVPVSMVPVIKDTLRKRMLVEYKTLSEKVLQLNSYAEIEKFLQANF